MPLRASAEELRLALVAVIGAASGMEAQTCPQIMDLAAAGAAEAPADVLRAVRATAVARLGAVRALSSLCAACGACPRGRPETGAAAAAKA